MKVRLLCLAAMLAAIAPLRAQSTFVVIEDGVPKPVRAISADGRPQYELSGKLHSSSGLTYSLRKAPIYGLGLIDVSKFEVEFTNSTSNEASLQLHIYGRLKADASLKNCFVVLRFTTDLGKGVHFVALPDLIANEEAVYDQVFDMPIHFEPGSGHYEMLFFSNGFQLLDTRMAPMYVAEQRQKTRDYLLQHMAH
jgi:hypothetical protein